MVFIQRIHIFVCLSALILVGQTCAMMPRTGAILAREIAPNLARGIVSHVAQQGVRAVEMSGAYLRGAGVQKLGISVVQSGRAGANRVLGTATPGIAKTVSLTAQQNGYTGLLAAAKRPIEVPSVVQRTPICVIPAPNASVHMLHTSVAPRGMITNFINNWRISRAARALDDAYPSSEGCRKILELIRKNPEFGEPLVKKALERFESLVTDVLGRDFLEDLAKIPGCGEPIAKKVLEHLESLTKTFSGRAFLISLAKIPGCGEPIAKKVLEHLESLTKTFSGRAFLISLAKIPGCGEPIAKKVLEHLESLTRDFSGQEFLISLAKIPGCGEPIAKKALEHLESLTRDFSGQEFLISLAKIPGCGEPIAKKVLEHLESLTKTFSGRAFLISLAKIPGCGEPIAKKVLEHLEFFVEDSGGREFLDNFAKIFPGLGEQVLKLTRDFNRLTIPLDVCVNTEARKMGITQIVLVGYSGFNKNRWRVSDYDSKFLPCYIYMPNQAEEVFLKHKEKSPDYYLFKGLLAHELGHVIAREKGHLTHSLESETFADTCIPSDEHILEAMRDYFVERHNFKLFAYYYQHACIDLADLNNLSASYLKKWDNIFLNWGDEHPSDIRRACYFNDRLNALLKQQESQKDAAAKKITKERVNK